MTLEYEIMRSDFLRAVRLSIDLRDIEVFLRVVRFATRVGRFPYERRDDLRFGRDRREVYFLR